MAGSVGLLPSCGQGVEPLAMHRQGEGLGPVGPDGGHGLLLWLAEGDKQCGRDQTGAAAAPLAVDDQVLAVPQQSDKFWQCLLPGGLEGGISNGLPIVVRSSALVEDRFGFVRVRGELSGLKRAASGHVYMALKDENARLDAVMWRGTAQRLNFQPEDGLEVIHQHRAAQLIQTI